MSGNWCLVKICKYESEKKKGKKWKKRTRKIEKEDTRLYITQSELIGIPTTFRTIKTTEK